MLVKHVQILDRLYIQCISLHNNCAAQYVEEVLSRFLSIHREAAQRALFGKAAPPPPHLVDGPLKSTFLRLPLVFEYDSWLL